MFDKRFFVIMNIETDRELNYHTQPYNYEQLLL